MNIPVPEHMHNAARTSSYNRNVFIAPPWRQIFHQDLERKQDFDEAIRTYETLAATYTALGHELVEIPRLPLDDRVSFILSRVGTPRS
jgi:predicted ATPase